MVILDRFSAVREDLSWRNGHAVVFSSLEQIIAHFTEFWNLFSYESIITGRLDSEFGPQMIVGATAPQTFDVSLQSRFAAATKSIARATPSVH